MRGVMPFDFAGSLARNRILMLVQSGQNSLLQISFLHDEIIRELENELI